MKKLFLLPLLAFLPLLAHAFAGEVEIDGINYFIKTSTNVAEVRAKTGDYSGDIVIPPTVVYDGVTCNVILIADDAFRNCTTLTSVTIPNSVTSIGNSAFYNCTSLTSVTIGNSVTNIGEYAFYNCKKLPSITIPNSVTSIGQGAFYGCTSLTSVTIPNSVTSIYNAAFYDCTSLTSVTIPNSVTSIGEYAFYNCKKLTSVTIGNSVTSIGYGVFRGCTSLTSITIPNSVTSIGEDAFENCSSLTSVTIPSSMTSIGQSAFYGCTSLTSVTIPNSVTSIGVGAFQNCTSLTSITIPNNVTSIGNRTFYNCSSLTSVTIPNSVTSIGGGAFQDCTSLTSVTIGSEIQNIVSEAFANCPDLANVYCLAVNVPGTNSNAFDGSYPQYATLHVPDESVDKYKNKSPWSKFGTIVGLSGGGGSNKCAKPTISYDNDNKKLKFGCDTEDVEFVTEIKDADIGKFFDDRINLTATYEISVYATKAGYENSDVATVTLVWGSATFTDTTPATAIEMVPAMEAAMPVLIQNNGGMLTVQGTQDGTPISVFTTAGMQAGSTISRAGLATLSTNLQPGSIAIVRIGNRSVKVVLK